MEKIKTFLSSAMSGELYAERAALKVAFKTDERVRHFYELYAIDDHASPAPIEKAYVNEVGHSKVFVLLLNRELRGPVIEEFTAAEEHSLDIFCYIKDQPVHTPEMKDFIASEAYRYHCGHFHTPEELATKVVDDLTDDLTRKYLRQIVNPKPSGGGQYTSSVSSAPNNEYRFHPVDLLIEASKREDVSKLDKDQLISLAMTLEQQHGDYSTALLLLEVGLLKWPDDWVLHNNRGIILDIMGIQDGALYSYQKVLRFKPESDVALYNIGNILMDQKRYGEAISYYEKCIELKPDKVDALNRLAACYRRKGEPFKALMWSSKALALSPDDEVALANHLLALSATGSHEAAFLESEKLKPHKHYYHLVRALVLIDSKKYEEALRDIDAILDFGALDYDLAIRKFYCLSALSRIDEAKDWIERIEKNYPVRAEDYNDIGYTLMSNFRLLPEAVELFRKAVSLKPELMPAWNNLQFCLGEQQLHEEVLKACDDALTINPFDTNSIKNKGRVLILLGKFDQTFLFMVQKGLELVGEGQAASELFDRVNATLRAQDIDVTFFNEQARKFLTAQQALLNSTKANQQPQL
jgi:tetratricopeptide (TPR) repeat protein